MNASIPGDDRNPSVKPRSTPDDAGNKADSPSAVGESTYVVSQPGKFSDPDATDAYTASSGTTPATDVPRLGEFDLLHEIGRGGMGVVWRARDRKLDREVAVKLLLDRFAPDTAAASRFLEEARITGQLQHPGIPAVYQISALADGRPFLAMKLIKGRTLHELIKAGAAVDTLGVFAAISQAVGYAHSRGVIHRDLKPQNIMVGAFGEVQVMDWGLAKVLDESARKRTESDPQETIGTVVRTDRDAETPYTQYGSMIGTPAYMAPEQAVGELDKIGPRADVFGLGAILCTLLTGKPPYDGQTAESVRVAALRGQTAEAFARLDQCAADPEVIALCKRCLAFDPVARPATGEAVAAEVAALRQAADERVRQAERDRLGAEVRAAEQIKRRQTLQWSAVVVAAVLLLGITGTTIGMFQAKTAWKAEQTRADSETKAKTEAQIQTAAAEKAAIAEKAAKEKAEARLAQIEKGVELFAGLLKGLNPRSEEEGGPPLYEQLRERASKAADELVADSVADEEAVARLQTVLGDTLRELGDYDKAVEVLERARATQEATLGTENLDIMTTLNNLALAYNAVGKSSEAIELLQQLNKVMASLQGDDHPDTLTAMNNLALAYNHAGQVADAILLFEQVMETRMELLGANHPDTLGTQNNLAMVYRAAGTLAEATALLEKVRDGQMELLGEEHFETLTTLNNLALMYHDAGRLPETITLYEQIKDVKLKKLGFEHPSTLGTLSNLAIAYLDVGRISDSIALNEEVRVASIKRLGDDHPDTLNTLNNLALAYHAASRVADASALWERVKLAREQILGADHPDTLNTMNNLALAYRSSGKTAEATDLFEHVGAAVLRKLGPDHPSTLTSQNNLAMAYQDAGRLDEAIALFEQVKNAQVKTLGADHPNTLSTLNNLALAYQNGGRLSEAIVLNEKVRDAFVAKLGADHPDSLIVQNNLANAYKAAGRLHDAIEVYERVIDSQVKKLGSDHSSTLTTLHNLAIAYHAAGDLTKSLELFEHAAGGIERLRFHMQGAGIIIASTIAAYEQAQQFDKAEAWRRKWLAVVKEQAGAESPQYAGELAALSLNLITQEKWTEAEAAIRECLAIREKHEPDDWRTFNTKAMLGAALVGQKNYADAEPLLLAGYEGMREREDKIPAAGKPRLTEALQRLVQLYEALEKPDDAAKWRKELDARKEPAK